MGSFGRAIANAAEQTLSTDPVQIALLQQQLGVLKEIANINRDVLSGGGVISGILGSSLDVLKGISADIQKAQQTVAPIIALVVEVEKIGQIIKGDVGLNLSSLVDATKGISDTLKGSIGINISDAITATGQRTADAISAHTDATKSVGQSIEAAGKAQADQTASVAEAIRVNSVWTKLGPEQVKMLRAATTCEGFGGIADVGIKAIEGVVESVVKTLACFIERDLLPIAKVLEDIVTIPFKVGGQALIDDSLSFFDAMGEADPRNANANAVKLLNFALLKGSEAHAVALAIEAVPYFKHIGFPQLAAFLVDIAGFNVVGRAVVGTRIRAAVETPLRYLAQRTHRPTLPDLRDAMEGWAKVGLSDDDLRELLRWHGVPDPFIPMFFEVATRQLRMREMALVFDNVEVDEAWLTRAIQKAGYRGETAIKMRAAIIEKSRHQHRQTLVDEMANHVKDGLRSVGWLQVNLRALGLSPATTTLISQSAALAHGRTNAIDMAKVWQTKAEQEIITLEEYRLALVGLGFTLDTVAIKVATVSAKLQGKIAKQEKAEHQQAIKKVQTTYTQAAIEAFRKGVIDEELLLEALVGIGIMPDQAQAMVALERAKAIQKPKAAKTIKEDPKAQKIIKARTDETLLLLHHDEITPDQALAILVGLGEDPALAEALVERELAKINPPKPVLAASTR